MDYNDYNDQEREEEGMTGGVKLAQGVDINDMRDGKGFEFQIDENDLPNANTDESSAYFEQADVYRNSELYNLGHSGDEDSEDEGDGLSTFERLKKKMENVTEDGGVMKRKLREGMGPSITEFIASLREKELEKPEGERREIQEDDIQLAYHYSAEQEDDLEPFDVTYLRDDRPQRAYINDEFFPGFKIALMSMAEKEVSDFLISPDYAFGKLGCPPRIKANATLRYKIEIVKFWATTELDSYARMSREQKRLVPVNKLVKLCSQQREEANKLFNIADFNGANFLYGKAIRILEDCNLQNDEDESLQQRALLKLYLNRSLCALKLERWDMAITFANRALDIDPKNSKALYRKAKGKLEFGDYMEAKRIAQIAHTSYPNDQGIGKLLADIDTREQRDKQREKNMCQKMFGQPDMPSTQKAKTSSFHKELMSKAKAELQEFVKSDMKEMKLVASSYTSNEMEALVLSAAELNLTSFPNKEGQDWISLKITK